MEPTPDAISQQAIEAAVRLVLLEVLTEPMTVEKLARIWGFNRNKMLKVLRRMVKHGAVQDGSTWQVPLFRMPARWLKEQGFLPAAP